MQIGAVGKCAVAECNVDTRERRMFITVLEVYAPQIGAAVVGACPHFLYLTRIIRPPHIQVAVYRRLSVCVRNNGVIMTNQIHWIYAIHLNLGVIGILITEMLQQHTVTCKHMIPHRGRGHDAVGIFAPVFVGDIVVVVFGIHIHLHIWTSVEYAFSFGPHPLWTYHHFVVGVCCGKVFHVDGLQVGAVGKAAVAQSHAEHLIHTGNV